MGTEFLRPHHYRGIFLLLAGPRAGRPRTLSRRDEQRLGLDPHQLLPRKPLLPSVGKIAGGPHPSALSRRMEKFVPRCRIQERSAPIDPRPNPESRNLHGPLVSRRQRTG